MATQTQALPVTQFDWKRWWPFLVIVVLIALIPLFPTEARPFPKEWNFGLRQPIDAFQSWVIQNRDAHPMFLYFFDPLSDVIDASLRAVEDGLLAIPWYVIVVAFGLAGYGLAGLRVGLLAVVGMLFMGLVGLWEPSMQTLALMGVSVLIALLIGIPLGVLAAQSDTFDKILRPILDAMQTMPAFVYLIPVVLFFGIARVPSVVATVIYALPPAIRLTSLGIRQVAPSAIEAARAFGSTGVQMLVKVQLPLALPAVMAGVNQTIMMALSIVVIAAMIGAGGLGGEVLRALQNLKVGRALEAGLAIVFMAIVLDRISEALSQVDQTNLRLPKWQAILVDRLFTNLRARDFAARYGFWIVGLVIVIVLILMDRAAIQTTGFPEDWRLPLAQPVDQAVKWMRDNLFSFPLGPLNLGTGPFSDFLTIYIFNPLRTLFMEVIPWLVTVAAVMALAYWAGAWRLAVGAGLGMLAVGLLGMWSFSMDTLSQVLITTVFTVGLAIPFGIWSSRSLGVRNAMRPVLDFLQTIPSFVFLVPVIMLFNIGRVPGLIASVLYAVAPGIKLTDLGIRQVAPEAVEAATAFGSTEMQTLTKVKLPIALPALLVATNQMIMMVLAMVIISGLVGGAGLGLEAVNGLARSETGRGLEAGLAIVILAIIIDRITQAWANKQ